MGLFDISKLSIVHISIKAWNPNVSGLPHHQVRVEGDSPSGGPLDPDNDPLVSANSSPDNGGDT